MTTIRGRVSSFGGPDDTGVGPDEGLAFIFDVSDAPHLFLPEQPPGTTGLARRLDPDAFYIAVRWDYAQTPKDMLPDMLVAVQAVSSGRVAIATPADWGPHEDTGRVADISPGLMAELEIETDDEVIVEFEPGVPAMPHNSIVISSGHSTKCRGASGVLDEVVEATRVVDRLGEMLRERGVDVTTYHDTISSTQQENLTRIVDFHNSKTRQLDVAIHLNAYVETSKPMGCEVLYVTQSDLAGEMSAAIADAGGLVDRGGKKRTDLYFLNNTEQPAILLEICFVDSTADAALYDSNFEAICDAIATTLSGVEGVETEPPPGEGEAADAACA